MGTFSTNLLTRKDMILTLPFFFAAIVREACSADVSTGILISGGKYSEESVEVFDPSTGQSCALPSLPDRRVAHSSNNLTLCGGYYAMTSCITFSSGEWVTSHTLVKERYFHSSWDARDGRILLLGGGNQLTDTTTETITQGQVDSQPGFTLQHWTRDACTIDDQGTFILTGGAYSMETVSRYDDLGFLEDLPSLIIGRKSHACGAYLMANGTQALLVAGGYDKYTYAISKTEIMTTMGPAWELVVNNLPSVLFGLRSVNIGWDLYIIGGRDEVFDQEEVYQWIEEDWVKVGEMKEGRSDHAVSTILLVDEVMQYCT